MRLEFVEFWVASKFQILPAAGHPKNIEAVQITDGVTIMNKIAIIFCFVGLKEVCLENQEFGSKHTDVYRKKASII